MNFIGLAETETIGKHIDVVFNTFDAISRDPAVHPFGRSLSRGSIVELQNYLILERVDGSEIIINATGAPITSLAGDTKGGVMTFRDVTAQRQIDSVVARQASYDSLTDLPNRREFHRRLERMFESSRQPNTEHALCIIDLDRFKVINDTLGHPAGDALLVQLSESMRAKIRKRDIVARLGGERVWPLDR